VCGACLQKSLIYFEKISKQFQNQECILEDRLPKRNISSVIELSDSDSDNDNATTEKPNQEEAKVTTSLIAVLNDTVGPMMTKQEKLCKSYLVSKKAKLDAGSEQLNNLMLKVDKGLKDLFNTIYKFDNQIKFKFDKEITITDDNYVATITEDLRGMPNDLPVKGKLLRHLLKVGDKVYGMKYSLLQPWVEGTVKSAVSDTFYNVIFDDVEEKVLNYKNLAYIDTLNYAQYPVGSRVIAKFQDMNIQLTDKFYVGVIAEPPKYLNNFRYV